eukprot:TRINITY_DN69339_c0_g1_i1.p1 TRINITY_DN69339_c0_g1~~TRINITY_DN69339_c0_g1_i1.p1  ORF type:complete len:283 (-),score=35.94 TRINITY_DN69339_c0_g1_i1:128-892(-)
MSAFRCDGLICFVTGSTSGIGWATCAALASAGATVFAVGRNEERGKALVEEVNMIAGSSGECSFHVADLRTRAACDSAVAAATALHGRVDALVHSAGVYPTCPIAETTDETWSSTMQIHVDAFFYLCRALTPGMTQRQSGVLLAIASNYGLVGAEDCAAYCASKGAVVAFVKALALELAPKNVRVNCICPGACETPMLGGPNEAAEYAQKSPSKELVQPADVANAAVYLTSPAGRMVRGVALLVDGGETAGCRA